MWRGPALALVVVIAASPVRAQSDYSQALTDAFAATCVPQRLSFDGTKAQALAEGWTAVPPSDHPELAALMRKSEEGLVDPEIKFTYAYETYRRDLTGMPHHLVVMRVSGVLPDLFTMTDIGCYIYDFAATEPARPEPVTALIGNPVSSTIDEDGLVGYVWGPPCPMPRTGDTYLTFIAESSPHADTTGFSGQLLKFSTSEPDPGEVVPETYC